MRAGGFRCFELCFLVGFLWDAGSALAALLVVAPGRSLVHGNPARLVYPSLVSADRPAVWSLVTGLRALAGLILWSVYEWRNGACEPYYCVEPGGTRPKGWRPTLLSERQYHTGLSVRFSSNFALASFLACLAASLGLWDVRVALLALVCNAGCEAALFFVQSRLYRVYEVKQE